MIYVIFTVMFNVIFNVILCIIMDNDINTNL